MNGIELEKASQRSFGMRTFKYVNTTIKEALENECPLIVSCAGNVTLSARDPMSWYACNIIFFLLMKI